MIQKIHIENYKSVQSLDIELGRLNVFIGANGCGKTNILEAIALGSAAAADRLVHGDLKSRGIRVTEPKAMRTGFNWTDAFITILVSFENPKGEDISFNIFETNDIPANWKANASGKKIDEIYNNLTSKISDEVDFRDLEDVELVVNTKKVNVKRNSSNTDTAFKDEVSSAIKSTLIEAYSEKLGIKNFLIFSPEDSFLRRFEGGSLITPLDIRGEGLFSHLLDLKQKPDILNQIKETLQFIDWFEDFEIPTDLYFDQKKIIIKDRFIAEGLQYFDQRSANEGFLYLLFYVTLFVSEYTPRFFAIDNIDNSLNPKLCSELTKMLARLAKEHDKQAILTTHNPAILDGLNLNDDEQRLFVIYRNADGHTKAKRVFKKEMPNGMEPVKLSEQFLRGYIGGLNRNF